MSSPTAWLVDWLEREQALDPRSGGSAALVADALTAVTAQSADGWFAAAALAEVLQWQGRLSEAADVAEATIGVFADVSGEFPITDQDTPFVDALLAEQVSMASIDTGRLARVAGALNPACELAQGLNYVLQKLADHSVPLTHLLSGYEHWDEPAAPLKPPYDSLVSKLDVASRAEVQRMWTGAYNSRDIDLGRRLFQRYGLVTPLWYVAVWFAGWQVSAGDPDGARSTLLAALPEWAPYAIWDVLPLGVTVQPHLGPVLTDEFRLAVLSQLPDTLPWGKRSRRKR